MMRIRAVCFDFDGTLAYMSPSHWALYAEAARGAGIDVSETALAADTTDRAWEPWMTPLGPVHLEASASQEAFRALRAGVAVDRIRAAATDAPEAALLEAGRRAAIFEEDAARYVLFDDALPALQRLADAGIESIVVSNHIWALPEIVDTLGAGALFGGVITSARLGYRKPHPAIFAEALRLTSARADEIVMVGDSVSADVRGAEAAGMHAVLIDREGTRELPDDVHVIRSLLDVPIEWPLV
ncbi:MAG: HAD family hydrolase [Chloroflexi bacterium]|nr:MAG: HAD family hydrolase [Chloroflexota bacterium]